MNSKERRRIRRRGLISQLEQQLNVVNNMIAEKSNAEVQKEEEKPIDPEKVVDKK